MATVATGNESTGPKSRRHMDTPSGSTPSNSGCARPTSGREATSPNASTAKVCSATTTEVCPATTTEVCSATATAMVLGGSIGSKRHAAKRDDCGQRKD